MLTRELLQPFSLDVLRGMARDYQLTPDPGASKEALIEMILAAQLQKNTGKGSDFIEQKDEGGSGFFSQEKEPDTSQFAESEEVVPPETEAIPPQRDGGSGFIQQNQGGSGFIQTDNGGSGFIQQNNDGSGFLQQDNGGSGFIQSGNDASGFVTETKGEGSGFVINEGEKTEHLSPLDPSGNVLLPEQPAGEKSRAHGLGPGDTL
ncbi:MAG: hypothetical protein AAFV07_12735, partial [Bacteroidota bacterium]